MPHIAVKLYPGPSEQEKKRLAEQIVKSVMATIGSLAKSVSVSIEEVGPEEWKSKVYDPEIKTKWDKLYKEPGYELR